MLGLKRNIFCEEEENPLFVSDEIIESLEKETQPKTVKVVQSARAKMANDFSGSVMIKPNFCVQSGSEWVIPCCVVQVEARKLKVPVLNMQTPSLNLRRKDFVAS